MGESLSPAAGHAAFSVVRLADANRADWDALYAGYAEFYEIRLAITNYIDSISQ